jgi:hypothetical protein
MSTNRSFVHRPHRVGLRPRFSAEAIALFTELEATKRRDTEDYQGKSEKLAVLLGLASEWLTGCVVTEANLRPLHPAGYIRNVDVVTVRQVRQQLLEAAGLQEPPPARPPRGRRRNGTTFTTTAGPA